MGTTWGDLTTWSSLTTWWSTGTTVVTPPAPSTTLTDGNYWSAYNTASPLSSKQRIHQPGKISLGFRTESGVELLPAFTGYTRDLATVAAAKSATLSMLDNAEAMRGKATLPFIVGDDLGSLRYGLSGSFVVDYAARRCGFYATPPQRSKCVLSATMAGSAWPEVGTGSSIKGVGGPLMFVSDATTIQGNYLSDNQAGFETSTVDWAPGGSVLPTLAHSSAHPSSGTYGLLITWGTGGLFPQAQTNVVGLTPGRSYLATANAWVPSGSPSPRLAVGTVGVGPISGVKDAPTTIQYVFTATTSTHSLQVWPETNPSSGQQCWIDDVRVIDNVSPTTDVAHRAFTETDPTTSLKYNLSAPVTLDGSNGVLVEMYEVGVDSGGADVPLWHMTSTEVSPLLLSCWVTAAGVVKVGVGTLASPTTMGVVSGPTIQFGASSQLSYLAVNVTASYHGTLAVAIRVNSTTATGSLYGLPTGPFGSVSFGSGYSTASAAKIFGSLSLRGVQVTGETSSDRGPFNDTFTPTSVIGPSLSGLTAIPATTGSWWDICSQIAGAEFATVEFDESGLLKYTNRARWTRKQNPVRFLTSLTSLKDFTISESIDSVRNIITIPANPIGLSAMMAVWDAAEAYTVPARGSLTVFAHLDNPVGSIDQTWRTTGLWAALPGQTQYRANTKIDGSGTAYSNLTFAPTILDSQTISVTILNPNSGKAYLVQPTGAPEGAGTPALQLWGRSVVSTSGKVSVVGSDTASIAAYGEQTLDVSDTPWRQTLDAAQSLVNDLLRSLRFPSPQLMDLQIVADPRNKLGDLVGVIDTSGTGVDHTFWIVGLRTTFDKSMTQVVTLRPAQKLRTGWVLGVTDNLGVQTILL